MRRYFLLLLAVVAGPISARENLDWRHYGSDLASTKFSPAAQLDSTNFDSLRIIWRWPSADRRLQGVESSRYRSTPIVVDGVLYTISPLAQVSALDAATGAELWSFDPEVWRQKDSVFWGYARGVSYWSDGEEARILFGTFNGYFYSLDAHTGKPDPAFGDTGRVDLTLGLGRPVDRNFYAAISPPAIYRDVAIIGSALMDWRVGRDLQALVPPGDVRGFDVRTGRLVWTFHAIPRPGEYGADTWAPEAWKEHGAANVWSMISVDEELGYVYLPFSTPDNDFYGGERLGDNLFGESLVCLNAATGERVWHYQLIHHGLWDYDIPAAPVLLDVDIDGVRRKIVAQVTKQAFTYVFDRVSGEPIWPIVEREVPQSKVPGEQSSPTQPFPTKPAPFDRQGISVDDLIDFTPELRQEALERLERHDYGPLFTPPTERGIALLPGLLGGADWSGATADPRRGVLYVHSKTQMRRIILSEPRASEAVGRFRFIGHAPYMRGPRGLPMTKPPYGRLTAIDMGRGEHLWMRPTGRGPVDHPAIRHLKLEKLGWNNRRFTISTANLLLATSGRLSGGGDYWRRPERFLSAYDPQDGRLVGQVPVPNYSSGGQMTYVAGGRQYVVVPTGREDRAELVALAIPRPGEVLPPQLVERKDAEHRRFYQAVALMDSGDVAGLEALLRQEGKALLGARGYMDSVYQDGYFQGASLLHHVAANPTRTRLPQNHLDIVGALLAAGADPQAETLEGLTPLELAINSSQLRRQDMRIGVLQALIEGGADLQHSDGLAIERVFSLGDTNLVALVVDVGFESDLRFAAALGALDQMKGFFDSEGRLVHGAVWADSLSRQQVLDTALGYAAYWGRLGAAQFLLGQGADINALPPSFYYRQEQGSTALHKAADGNRLALVRWLLDQGANPILGDKQYDSTPRDWARYGGANDEVKELLRQAEEGWRGK